jgi:hypothetical protein
MFKEFMWEIYPGCGLIVNKLSITHQHQALQLVGVMPSITDSKKIIDILNVQFHENLVTGQELSSGGFKSVVACTIEHSEMWNYYAYHMQSPLSTDKMHLKISYGLNPENNVLHLITPPSNEIIELYKKNPPGLTVWQPSKLVPELHLRTTIAHDFEPPPDSTDLTDQTDQD